MKKRYLLILLITLLTSICFVIPIKVEAKAEYYCTYSTSGKDIKIKFRLDMSRKGGVKAEEAELSGKDVETNFWFNTNSETVQNWSSKFKKVNFTGQEYYLKNTSCPPKAILALDYTTGVNWHTRYHLYVSDEAHIEELKKAIKSEYSRLLDGYPIVFDLNQQTKEESPETPASCLEFNEKASKNAKKGTAEYYSCENNPYFACIWNDKYGYCNVDNLQYVMCGDARDIPKDVPALISFFVNLLKIATPIILIATSMITLLKALSASKEDEIKKAKNALLRKIIASVMVFFVISIVQFVILKVAQTSEAENISSCMSCFLNNDCSVNTYYKTTVSGVDICTNLYGEDVKCSK